MTGVTTPSVSRRPEPPPNFGIRAGVLTWIAAATPLVVGWVQRPELMLAGRQWLALVAVLAFGGAFLLAWNWPWWRAWVQVLSAAIAIAARPFPLPGVPALALLCVVALPQFATLGRGQFGLPVLLAQTSWLAWVYHPHLVEPTGLLVFLASLAGFQAFALAAGRMVAAEAAARREAATALAAMAAMQTVAGTNERLAERVRIARDLHDSIGHHLASLALHLDLARRQDASAARTTLATAHAVCRVLLAELRDVLADVRATDAAEFATAIEDLVARVPSLPIALELQPMPAGLDAELAQLALRCVQEAVTNVLRHAEASRLQLQVLAASEGLQVIARDDGRGIGAWRPGGGLLGLQARLQQIGGLLRVERRSDGPGTEFCATIPWQRGAA
jgi:signal transduction histidine kinase